MGDTGGSSFGDNYVGKLYPVDPVETQAWPYKGFNASYGQDYVFLHPFLPFAVYPYLDFDPLTACYGKLLKPSLKYMITSEAVPRFDYWYYGRELPSMIPKSLIAIPKDEWSAVLGFIAGTAVSFTAPGSVGASVLAYGVQELKVSDDPNGLVIYAVVCGSSGKLHCWKKDKRRARPTFVYDVRDSGQLDWGDLTSQAFSDAEQPLVTDLGRIDLELEVHDTDEDANIDGVGDG